MKNEKEMNKTKRKKYLTITLVFVLLFVALFLAYLNNSSFSKENSSENITSFSDESDFYDKSICNCTEYGRHVCLSGFYYNETRKLCVNPEEKTVTYSKNGCNVYDCAGTVYAYNIKNKQWEKEVT